MCSHFAALNWIATSDELGDAELTRDCVPFVRNAAYKKHFMLKLAEVVLPGSPSDLREAGYTRANCLGITALPPPYVGAPQDFLVHATTLDALRESELYNELLESRESET
jgi:hypothetical protein